MQVIKSSERGESSRSKAERLGGRGTQIQTTIRGKLMCCQSLRQKTTQKENVKLHCVQYVVVHKLYTIVYNNVNKFFYIF